MKWKVIWKPQAERQLTAIWLADRSRQRVREAADQIDEQLAIDPFGLGESRESPNRRIVFASPLAALVEVDETDQNASVLLVFRY